MLFSVIVPVYNVAEWLVECIESILKQTYNGYELILVDDGSTDESGKICEEYAGRYSHVKVIHKGNGGLSEARNFGEKEAVGEYILFVDSDDYIAEWTLERACKKIQEFHPDIVLSEGTYQVLGKKVILNKFCDANILDEKNGEETLLITTSIGPNWSACDKIYRRKFWRDHGFEFVKGRLSEDFQLIDRVVLEADRICAIETFYYYRIREGSIVNSYNPKRISDRWKNFADWDVYIKCHSINPQLKKQIYAMHAQLLKETIFHDIVVYDRKYLEQWIQEAQKYLYYFKYTSSWKDKCLLCLSDVIGLKRLCLIFRYIKKRGMK